MCVSVDLPVRVCVCVFFLSRDCGMLLDETPLFEPSLLQELDWSSNTVSFSPPISPSSPGEGLVLRPLRTADFNRGESETGWTTYSRPVLVFSRQYESGDHFVIDNVW